MLNNERDLNIEQELANETVDLSNEVDQDSIETVEANASEINTTDETLADVVSSDKAKELDGQNMDGEEACDCDEECEEKVSFKQFVLFKHCDDLYASPIDLVFEILKWDNVKIAPMPNTKDYVLGLINLRGEIIPVVHMGKRFGTGCTPRESKNRIIVFNCQDKFMGLLVDSVEDLIEVAEDKVVSDFVKEFAIGNENIESAIFKDTDIIGVLDIGSLNI